MLIISLFLLFMIEYIIYYLCELYFYTRKLIIIVNVD